jgi:hypothetical protein
VLVVVLLLLLVVVVMAAAVAKGRTTFRKYIPKKHKCFGKKVYKLCGMSVYIYMICASA